MMYSESTIPMFLVRSPCFAHKKFAQGMNKLKYVCARVCGHKMGKLPVHSNQVENPGPTHELSHSVQTLGGKNIN